MVKTWKISFSGTKWPMTLKVWMQHQVLKYYQVCSIDDSGLTLTYFTTRYNLVPYAFVWDKVKTMNFSETIVVYDIEVGICSQVNECMKFYEYQRSVSLIDLGPNLSDSIVLNWTSFPKSPLSRLKPNFIWSLLGMGEWQFVQMVQVTWQ